MTSAAFQTRTQADVGVNAFPDISLRWLPIWRRNYLVWKRLFVQSATGWSGRSWRCPACSATSPSR